MPTDNKNELFNKNNIASRNIFQFLPLEDVLAMRRVNRNLSDTAHHAFSFQEIDGSPDSVIWNMLHWVALNQQPIQRLDQDSINYPWNKSNNDAEIEKLRNKKLALPRYTSFEDFNYAKAQGFPSEHFLIHSSIDISFLLNSQIKLDQLCKFLLSDNNELEISIFKSRTDALKNSQLFPGGCSVLLYLLFIANLVSYIIWGAKYLNKDSAPSGWMVWTLTQIPSVFAFLMASCQLMALFKSKINKPALLANFEKNQNDPRVTDAVRIYNFFDSIAAQRNAAHTVVQMPAASARATEETPLLS